MIFDCAYVTSLVLRWQHTQDKQSLEVILDHSKSLIEALVSEYDPFYRDDLIQEASFRVQYALPYFKPDRTRPNLLHTYLTTVIKNCCLTYLRKQSRHSSEIQLDLLDIDIIGAKDKSSDTTNIVEDLIVHNRKRFPSVPVDVIDEISEYICEYMTYDAGRRVIISKLSEVSGADRALVDIVYTSSLLYLRSRYIGNAECGADDELSIITDLKLLFGDKIGEQMAIIFSGMTIKFP